MNLLKFRSDNQICKILKVDSIKKKNTKAELFLSVFVTSAFWTFLDDHDPTESFFLLCVNCYVFLEKRVKWFSIAFSTVWNSVFLNWLLPKIREPSLLCYLTTSLVEKRWVYAFHKGIWVKVNNRQVWNLNSALHFHFLHWYPLCYLHIHSDITVLYLSLYNK